MGNALKITNGKSEIHQSKIKRNGASLKGKSFTNGKAQAQMIDEKIIQKQSIDNKIDAYYEQIIYNINWIRKEDLKENELFNRANYDIQKYKHESHKFATQYAISLRTTRRKKGEMTPERENKELEIIRNRLYAIYMAYWDFMIDSRLRGTGSFHKIKQVEFRTLTQELCDFYRLLQTDFCRKELSK